VIEDTANLTNRADGALYAAKRAGRHRVVVAA
jgi:PleD family two-component response regulator